MKCDFDQSTGRLRCDAAGFDALYALATEDALSNEDALALHEAGVLEADGVHRSLEPGMHALGHTVAHAQLSLMDHSERAWAAHAWVSGQAAAFLLSSGDLLDEVVITGPRFFPAAIARVVGLGPRLNREFTGWRMPVDHCEQLISGRQSQRERIAETLQPGDELSSGFLASIVEGPWHYWTLDVQWDLAPGHEPRPPLHILDTTHAIAVLTPTGADVSIEALTPTETWLALTMSLPVDDELQTE